MLLPIAPSVWQILRAVLRAEVAGAPALGRDLRLTPTRRTRDGTFLDDLVRDGLLVAIGKPDPPGPGPAVPLPFRTRYQLTALGRHAAEYGEYDRELTRSAGGPTPGPAAGKPRTRGRGRGR